MGSFSIWHWLIVLVIVMLIFGTKKLRNMGADLGGAVRGFKDGMREGGEKPDTNASVANKTIKGEGKGKTEQKAWAVFEYTTKAPDRAPFCSLAANHVRHRIFGTAG